MLSPHIEILPVTTIFRPAVFVSLEQRGHGINSKWEVAVPTHGNYCGRVRYKHAGMHRAIAETNVTLSTTVRELLQRERLID